MADPGALGAYLRARREQVDPATLGLPVTGTRRTPGLRREEVAALAGVSADYYLRLEQGRDRNPSPAVLQALARVLQLDETSTDHLMSLVAARPVRRRPAGERVPDGILELLRALSLPAFVENRTFDVLAANPLASALFPAVTVGANRLRAVFLDDRERALHADWERAATTIVASFRASVGARIDDPRAVRLVGELSLASEEFRRLWARHDVRPLAGGVTRLEHPQVGALTLRLRKLPLADTDGQLLVIYHADPETPSGAALALLGSLSVTPDDQDTPQHGVRNG
ncbi:helix-turn-helix domain-containing protein [Actinophytocola sp. KF-1]